MLIVHLFKQIFFILLSTHGKYMLLPLCLINVSYHPFPHTGGSQILASVLIKSQLLWGPRPEFLIQHDRGEGENLYF